MHIVSPFTDPLDRAVAEYVTARDYIRTHLSDVEAKTVLDHDPVEQAFGMLRRSKKWTDREDGRTDSPSDTPGSPPR